MQSRRCLLVWDLELGPPLIVWIDSTSDHATRGRDQWLTGDHQGLCVFVQAVACSVPHWADVVTILCSTSISSVLCYEHTE